MNYRLRPATDANFDSLTTLHEATMRPTVAQIQWWHDARQAAIFRERFDAAARHIVVDGQEAGVRETAERPDAVFLASIEIAPEHQGFGPGATIIRDNLREAHGRGLPVALKVNRSTANDV